MIKLSEEKKQELRKEIYEKAKKVPEGQRIEIDNDILEELIFFKAKMLDGTTFKIPIWTGDFLSKIDLSKLSFEGVRFDLPFCTEKTYNQLDDETKKHFTSNHFVVEEVKIEEFYFPPYLNNEGYVYNLKENDDNSNEYERKISALCSDEYAINFANTNINLTSLPEYLTCCNFENVDLSKIRPFFLVTSKCNFKNTNLKIDDPMFFVSQNKYCNYSDNDFSNLEINKYIFIELFELDKNNRSNNKALPNLSNTGINFEFSTTKMAANMMRKYSLDRIYALNSVGKKCGKIENYIMLDRLKEILSSGVLEGCYINGKLIEKETTINDIPLTESEIKEFSSIEGKVLRKTKKEIK